MINSKIEENLKTLFLIEEKKKSMSAKKIANRLGYNDFSITEIDHAHRKLYLLIFSNINS